MSINCIVNGDSVSMPTAGTVYDLIVKLELLDKKIAVECAGSLVPRSTWSEKTLADNEKIEIVSAIGGG